MACRVCESVAVSRLKIFPVLARIQVTKFGRAPGEDDLVFHALGITETAGLRIVGTTFFEMTKTLGNTRDRSHTWSDSLTVDSGTCKLQLVIGDSCVTTTTVIRMTGRASALPSLWRSFCTRPFTKLEGQLVRSLRPTLGITFWAAVYFCWMQGWHVYFFDKNHTFFRNPIRAAPASPLAPQDGEEKAAIGDVNLFISRPNGWHAFTKSEHVVICVNII